MNSATTPAEKRAYRQGARAEAAEATGRRIVDAFIAAMERDWMEDITLDRIAADAEVTVQTVIRRFGGKDGLIQAAAREIGRQVMVRRELSVGDLRRAVANLIEDYEVSGDMVIRSLAQELRFPSLKPLLDFGRSEHRRWLSQIAAPWLEPLTPETRRATLDALVVATDVYVWKLLRRDMGHSREAVEAMILGLATSALRLFAA